MRRCLSSSAKMFATGGSSTKVSRSHGGRSCGPAPNPASDRINHSLRLYLGVWENPRPDQQVTQLDFVGIKDGPCAPFCMAITAEEPAR